ncbi:hypothetical protein WAI453_013237 [Rhynchosporium graminicola]
MDDRLRDVLVRKGRNEKGTDGVDGKFSKSEYELYPLIKPNRVFVPADDPGTGPGNNTQRIIRERIVIISHHTARYG